MSGASPSARPPGPLVLLVDDVEDARQMYSEYLTHTGWRVETASDGQEAMEKALEHSPDVIVMDLAMPGFDGWSATRALKADPRTARIPIIVLSAHALADSIARAREAGCDAYLTKPCLPDQLVAELQRQLGSRSRKRR